MPNKVERLLSIKKEGGHVFPLRPASVTDSTGLLTGKFKNVTLGIRALRIPHSVFKYGLAHEDYRR